VLLIAFAASMGYGTFIENDFGTPAARALIYDAWWFELILIGLGVNFGGNIFRYQLFRKEKWPLLIFHVAFVVILLGALITRYTGLEGLVRIREGKQSDILISQKHYLQATIETEGQIRYFEKPLTVSFLTPPEFEENIGTQEQPLWIRSRHFVPDAEENIVPGDQQDVVLQVVTALVSGREDHFLPRGKSFSRGEFTLAFDDWKDGAINIHELNGQFLFKSPWNLEYLTMATQQAGLIPSDSLVELKTGTLYQGNEVSFVIGAIHQGKKIGYKTTEDKEQAKILPDVLSVEIQKENDLKTIVLKADQGLLSRSSVLDIGGTRLQLNYGPKPIKLPFSLHLNDFQLERYPGSTSPSSYASEITVIDGESSYPYRIFMNNVLDHRGYRFFQASYDLELLPLQDIYA